MSQQLISRSPDLKRLRDEGYDLEVRGAHLLIKDVPYVDARREVRRGVLVLQLDMAGDITMQPRNHVAWFGGAAPCHRDGGQMTQIINSSETKLLDAGVEVNHYFSAMPPGGRYADYYEKVTTYVALLASPAEYLSPGVTAKTFPVIEEGPDTSVFHYMDTASSRAGIALVTRKLELGKVAIVGLGGTGSYVLDQVAKTPVKEIHLFDGDTFSQHNAFRAPGAPSRETLADKPKKVTYLFGVYSRMHRGIVAHDAFIDESNVAALRNMDFVFICLDKGEPKRIVVQELEAFGVPFVDVGMGLYIQNDSLYGVLRVTTSTAKARDHVRAKSRIPFAGGDGDDEYGTNVQVADLNALNAALAVVKWKKLLGFYGDLEREHFSAYTVDGNALVNEDRA